MKYEQTRSRLPSLAVLLVLCLFAGSLLLVLLTGGNVYSRLSRRSRENFDKRTVCQYLATRVRQGDREGGITIEDFGGCDALVLRQVLDGKVYLTRIYCYDGSLMELYTPDSGDFSPADGEKLLDAAGLELQLQGQLLTVTVRFSDGSTRSLQLTVRSTQGGIS